MCSNIFKKTYGRLFLIIKGVIVFGVCCFAWIFFRAQNIQQAIYILKHMFDGSLNVVNYLRLGWEALGVTRYDGIFVIVALVILLIYDGISIKTDVIEKISSKPLLIRWFIYVVAVLLVIFFRKISQNQAFIYFQF